MPSRSRVADVEPPVTCDTRGSVAAWSAIPTLRASFVAGVVDPALLQRELYPGQGEHDDEEDPGQRRSVAHEIELERAGIQVVDEKVGRVGRAALSADVRH